MNYWWWNDGQPVYLGDSPVPAEREIYKVVLGGGGPASEIEALFNAITAEDPEWTLEYVTEYAAVFVKTVPVAEPAK